MQVFEPYEAGFQASLQKVEVFSVGFEGRFVAVDVPKISGISSDTLDEGSISSNFPERMCYVEKNKLGILGSNQSSANKGLDGFASPVLATQSLPPFFIS